MKRILTLLFYFCTLFSAYSQGGWKVFSYTQQSWAGGIAGKQGTYINIVLEQRKMLKPDSIVALQVLGSRFAIPAKGEEALNKITYMHQVQPRWTHYNISFNILQRMPYLSLNGNDDKPNTIPFRTYNWPSYDCLMCINPKTKTSFFIKLPKPEMLPSVSYP